MRGFYSITKTETEQFIIFQQTSKFGFIFGFTSLMGVLLAILFTLAVALPDVLSGKHPFSDLIIVIVIILGIGLAMGILLGVILPLIIKMVTPQIMIDKKNKIFQISKGMLHISLSEIKDVKITTNAMMPGISYLTLVLHEGEKSLPLAIYSYNDAKEMLISIKKLL